MKLSGLIKKLEELKIKFNNDVEVVVDTEAKSFNYHYVNISDITPQLSNEAYIDYPEFLNDPDLNNIIIHLDNKINYYKKEK